jgi:hypothetical protein
VRYKELEHVPGGEMSEITLRFVTISENERSAGIVDAYNFISIFCISNEDDIYFSFDGSATNFVLQHKPSSEELILDL